MKNTITPFIFEELDIRGRFIRLDDEWQKWIHNRHDTQVATRLLGQCAAFVGLVAADVKTLSKLTLQLRGTGKVKTLVVQCDVDEQNLKLRGMIDAPTLDATDCLESAFGDGDLAFTLYNRITNHDYQSIVPMMGDHIESVLAHYLTQSVQQPVRIWLRADEQCVTGLLLEKMPNSDEKDADGWQRINHLADTLTNEELTQLPLTTILHRLFHEETISLYPSRALEYHCPDERLRVSEVIKSLGQSECEDILATQNGRIIIHNEICNRSYIFTEKDIAQLFNSTTLH